jgi:dienelactone hydrolase
MNALRPFVCSRLVITLLSGLVFARPSPPAAAELVKFESAAQGSGSTVRIQGELSKPKGEGPFPAVVLLHSCLGPPATKTAIVDQLASWGYVALFVDDFTTRNIHETCAVDFAEGLSDAYGALLYLAKFPYVDAKRVGAVGYSQGADTALQIASARPYALPRDLKFKAAVAFYPPCANQAAARIAMPTLILIGASDNVTPATDCEELSRRQRADIKLIVYPAAYHGFDDPSLDEGKRLFGMWMKYDPDAAERSKSQMRDFLAAKLKR